MGILVVDDQKDVRDMLALSLNLLFPAINVFSAQSGHEALEIVLNKDLNIRLLFIDYNMPVLDGIQTVRIIRSCSLNENDLAVIIMSGRYI